MQIAALKPFDTQITHTQSGVRNSKVRNLALSLTSVFQNIRELFFQSGDRSLDFLRLPGVFHLVAGIFLFGNHAFHQIFIQSGLVSLRLLQPPFIFRDMRGVFLCQHLVDTGLVNAVQKGFQRSYILDIGFQAFLNTVDQIAFLQHHRVGAAVLLACGIVIVMVLLRIQFSKSPTVKVLGKGSKYRFIPVMPKTVEHIRNT